MAALGSPLCTLSDLRPRKSLDEQARFGSRFESKKMVNGG
jgi:hypothetical protein